MENQAEEEKVKTNYTKEEKTQDSNNSQNTFISILNISASFASLAAFIVMIVEKTEFPIQWGSLAGAFMFGLSIISTCAGAIYYTKYIHSILKDQEDLLKALIWPISILLLCFLLFVSVMTCYIFLYDGISVLLNNTHFA